MIVHDLYVRRAPCRFRPFKTYPPLLIDTDLILAGPIASQRFKPVVREAGEVGKPQLRIRDLQAFPTLPIKALERPHEFAFGESSVRLSLKLKIIVAKSSGLYDVRQT
jgi:hypothetical protein